jgi:two-component system, OmpR family, KDP operon response regulator KdpE
MPVKLLVCEDDRGVAELVTVAASMAWPNCEVVVATNGEEAIGLFKQTSPDLVVLDIEIPPPNGFEVCKRVRALSKAPVIMISAHDAISDKVKAFNLGADDYLGKPFDPLELVMRMRALVRRASDIPADGSQASREDVVIGDFSLNMLTHEVRVNGQLVRLTSTEYRLLEEMVRHVGIVLPHDMLLRRVWGHEYAGEERYLKVFVRRLRRKLGDNTRQPRYIQTEWGVGYRFVPQA